MQKLTKEQAVVISAYTGALCCAFSDMHAEIEKRLGRPVYTHELGSKKLCEDVIKPAFKDDFLAMVPKPENKAIVRDFFNTKMQQFVVGDPAPPKLVCIQCGKESCDCGPFVSGCEYSCVDADGNQTPYYPEPEGEEA